MLHLYLTPLLSSPGLCPGSTFWQHLLRCFSFSNRLISASVHSLKEKADPILYFVEMQLFGHFPLLAWEMGNAKSTFFPAKLPPTHISCPLLTQTVVSIMCQVESIIAGASVIARDVDTVVHATCIILSFTLIHICGQRGAEAARPTCVPLTIDPWAQPCGGFKNIYISLCECVCVCVYIVTFITYKPFCILFLSSKLKS